MVQEGDAAPQVYEYGSLEEMQADPRVKGKYLPPPPPPTLRDVQVGADRINFMIRDSLTVLNEHGDKGRSRTFIHGSPDSTGQVEHIMIIEDIAPGDIRQPIKGRDPMKTREVNVMRQGPLAMEELPESARKMLEKGGFKLEEGQKIMIVKNMPDMPFPIAPPLPPLPADAPEGLPAWLEELQVFPNPTDDWLRVRLRTKNSGSALLTLTDLNGKVVYQEKIAAPDKLVEKTLKTPAGKKGLHILQLEQAGQKWSKRIMLK